MYWVTCILIFLAQMVGTLCLINQRFLIQKINLPEVQGFISGAAAEFRNPLEPRPPVNEGLPDHVEGQVLEGAQREGSRERDQ